ncbi:MAG: hypothetical protein AABY22_31515, partial [Nanoarchaeota archaeon]
KEIIGCFKVINPTYMKFFKNKSQRAAVERLLKKLSAEKLKQVISKLPETNQQRYAPSITTPIQLEDKLASLLVFLKKESNKGGYIEL